MHVVEDQDRVRRQQLPCVGRVHITRRRPVDGVDLRRHQHVRVALPIPGIAVEIFARAELDRIHEHAHHDHVVLGMSGLDQAHVACMQGAHRGDEADRPGLPAPRTRPLAHGARVFDYDGWSFSRRT